MSQNLGGILGALLIGGCLLVMKDCGRQKEERDLARWTACVSACGGSVIVDSSRCLCVGAPP